MPLFSSDGKKSTDRKCNHCPLTAVEKAKKLLDVEEQ